MSQAAIEWLEDEETQYRIEVLREILNDYSNHEGFITVWPSMEECLIYVKKELKITCTKEDIEFVNLKSYFRSN